MPCFFALVYAPPALSFGAECQTAFEPDQTLALLPLLPSSAINTIPSLPAPCRTDALQCVMLLFLNYEQDTDFIISLTAEISDFFSCHCACKPENLQNMAVFLAATRLLELIANTKDYVCGSIAVNCAKFVESLLSQKPIKLHRADRVKQEIKHRNSTENPGNFESKTPSADFPIASNY